MASGYYPLVLDGGLAADGEGAQLLSITDGGSPALAMTRLAAPQPYRKGKMRIELMLVLDSTTITNNIAITVRSPFPSDAGAVTNRPLLTVSGILTSPVSAARFMLLGSPVPVSPVPTVDPAFAATFNSKAIPNWTAILNFQPADTELVNVILGIDFGASVAN